MSLLLVYIFSAVQEAALPSDCLSWHLKTSYDFALVSILGAYPILKGHYEGEKSAQNGQYFVPGMDSYLSLSSCTFARSSLVRPVYAELPL